MNKRIFWPIATAAFLFCAATAIVSHAQTFASLVSFNGTNGANPQFVALVQGTDGNFYGTTSGGGANTFGTAFRITPAGILTTIHSFDGIHGGVPQAGLILAKDGSFYGTTYQGGIHHNGTVYRITPEGRLTTLHSFDAADGANPVAALVQAGNRNLYGTTFRDGANGYGTIFTITPQGALTLLHNFDAADGSGPVAGLVQVANGDLMGTTAGGGIYGNGTVFTMTPDGTLTTLYSFEGADGSSPGAVLFQSPSGMLYGTTESGGAHANGTVFTITLQGALTILHSFAGTDGSEPTAGLVQATDGNLYGTTYQGGRTCVACGTIFSISPAGKLITLHSFTGIEGANPFGGLVQGTDGNFYGLTYGGGSLGNGTVFRFSVGLGPFVKTLPTFGKLGTAVTILGTNLTGTTSISFNGTAASFTVASPTEILTKVPTGATTGKVQVSTPGGTLFSGGPFLVRP